MRNSVKTAIFYISLSALGVVLYILARKYATYQRGYSAYGGEVFLLALPGVVAVSRVVLRDLHGKDGEQR
jgi:hypothetical protein